MNVSNDPIPGLAQATESVNGAPVDWRSNMNDVQEPVPADEYYHSLDDYSHAIWVAMDHYGGEDVVEPTPKMIQMGEAAAKGSHSARFCLEKRRIRTPNMRPCAWHSSHLRFTGHEPKLRITAKHPRGQNPGQQRPTANWAKL